MLQKRRAAKKLFRGAFGNFTEILHFDTFFRADTRGSFRVDITAQNNNAGSYKTVKVIHPVHRVFHRESVIFHKNGVELWKPKNKIC